MIFSLKYQLDLIVFSLASGIIIGIFFDIYRMLRGLKHINSIVSFIEDILFWIFMSIIIFIFIFTFFKAYLSVYVYIMIALGIYFYIYFFSKHFIKITSYISGILIKNIRVFLKYIFYPLNLLFYDKLKKIKNNKK